MKTRNHKQAAEHKVKTEGSGLNNPQVSVVMRETDGGGVQFVEVELIKE